MRSILANKTVVKVITLLSYIFDSNKKISDFYRTADGKAFKEIEIDKIATYANLDLAVVAHVFYEDFIPVLFEKLKAFPMGQKVFISTPRLELAQVMLALSDRYKLASVIKVVPNRGRNFGPLLVEFSKELLQFRYFVHVHSKKSLHAGDEVSRSWAARNVDFLLDVNLIYSICAHLERSSKLGLAYVGVKDMLRTINFRWGINRHLIRRLSRKLGNPNYIRTSGLLNFPAGGMFVARTKSIEQLLSAKWGWDDFPPECGQLEGTTQHAIERLVGELSIANGYSHLVYNSISANFHIEPENLADD